MPNLTECRERLDRIDTRISELFLERMDVARDVAAYKLEHGMPVLDRTREQDIVHRAMDRVPPELASYAAEIQETLMAASRDVQQCIIEDRDEGASPEADLGESV